MKNQENYAFPTEAELKEIREKTSNPNYRYKNQALSPHASVEEKFKYQICQAILSYQQESNLPTKNLAKMLNIPLIKTYDILLGKIEIFGLGDLVNYLEKLPVSLEVKIASLNQRQINHI
jgi:predicted XRE-type DNA-binding protein